MPGVVRLGDLNAGGGVVVTGRLNVQVNGRPIVCTGDLVTPHICCGLPGCTIHCAAVTTLGSLSVSANGRPVVYIGSPDSCFHPRVTGSLDVNVGIT